MASRSDGQVLPARCGALHLAQQLARVDAYAPARPEERRAECDEDVDAAQAQVLREKARRLPRQQPPCQALWQGQPALLASEGGDGSVAVQGASGVTSLGRKQYGRARMLAGGRRGGHAGTQSQLRRSPPGRPRRAQDHGRGGGGNALLGKAKEAAGGYQRQRTWPQAVTPLPWYSKHSRAVRPHADARGARGAAAAEHSRPGRRSERWRRGRAGERALLPPRSSSRWCPGATHGAEAGRHRHMRRAMKEALGDGGRAPGAGTETARRRTKAHRRRARLSALSSTTAKGRARSVCQGQRRRGRGGDKEREGGKAKKQKEKAKRLKEEAAEAADAEERCGRPRRLAGRDGQAAELPPRGLARDGARYSRQSSQSFPPRAPGAGLIC